MSAPPRTPPGAKRVVICDYNTLLQSVTALLRMSGYAVFQAYDGEAASDICRFMPVRVVAETGDTLALKPTADWQTTALPAGPAGGVRVDENYYVETKRLDPAVRAAASAPTGQ